MFGRDPYSLADASRRPRAIPTYATKARAHAQAVKVLSLVGDVFAPPRYCVLRDMVAKGYCIHFYGFDHPSHMTPLANAGYHCSFL